MTENENTTQDETKDGTEAAAAEITYPIVESITEDDGGIKVTSTYKDGSSNYKKTWPDGRVETDNEVNPDGKPFIITRFTNGDIHYTAPSGMKVEIKCGSGKDVMKARRNVGNALDEEAFTVALMANLCKINGKMIPYEIYAEQFSVFEFMAHMQYFKEKNF